MNTQQLQDYMASSLYGLARVCETNQKTENTDKLMLRILSEEGLDMESLLIRIEEINEEKKKICLEDCCLEPAINLNQLYSFQQNQTAQQTRLWSGLKKIAVNLTSMHDHSDDHQDAMKFIYRALQGLGQSDDIPGTLKEMDIVYRLSC